MNEENIFFSAENCQGYRQFNTCADVSEKIEVIDSTEQVVETSVEYCDLTELTTIGFSIILLFGIVIGLLIIGIFTKRWHT